MRKIYTAEHPVLAHLVAGLLEEHGVRAVVEGEQLFGVRGEIGMDFGSAPSVWVEDAEAERAARIVRDHEERMRERARREAAGEAADDT